MSEITWQRGEKIIEAWEQIGGYLSRGELESIYERLSRRKFLGDGGPHLIANLAHGELVRRDRERRRILDSLSDEVEAHGLYETRAT